MAKTEEITGVQKAAILLIALGPDKSSNVFKHLKEDEIEQLTLEIANTRSVSPAMKDAVLDEFYEVCLAQQYIAEGGIGIETRVTDIDGVPVMEVIDDERFYDSFNWEPENGGFEPVKKASGTTGSKKINVLVACGQTCKTVPKIASIYYFDPGAHTEGDGYLYQNRSLSDVFVFPNGRDGKVDSVYVDVDTTEYTGE